MPLTIEDLQNPNQLESIIWRFLARGAVDAKHAFRFFSIATVNPEGWPDTRTVVLRECDIAAKALYLHTDIRSGKIAHIKEKPKVCLLFWHPKQSLQLRIYGNAYIHHMDEIARKKIADLPPQQIALYGFHAKPGSRIAQDNEHAFDETLVMQNFAWVRVAVQTIDALHLGRNGVHTRVQFSYQDGSLHSSSYLKA
jgi:pyridoxamine 5'-phosphate oxidase